MVRRGKSLSFEAEEIEELADMSYGDKRLFALLSLVFPFINTGYNFHIDHVFPQAAFSKRTLERDGVTSSLIEEFKENSDRLGNLQLLLGAINNEKRKTMPAEWLKTQFPDAAAREAYIDTNRLGTVPSQIAEFPDFYLARRNRLRDKIASLL